jgi:hypothetical protein
MLNEHGPGAVLGTIRGNIARHRGERGTGEPRRSEPEAVALLAMPLFRRLDPEQKRDLMALARSLGIFRLAIAF